MEGQDHDGGPEDNQDIKRSHGTGWRSAPDITFVGFDAAGSTDASATGRDATAAGDARTERHAQG